LRFLGIILRVLRLEVSVYNVYITNQFQTTFAQREGSKIKTVVPIMSKNSASVHINCLHRTKMSKDDPAFSPVVGTGSNSHPKLAKIGKACHTERRKAMRDGKREAVSVSSLY
jgi:hypothetical protein